MNSIAKAKALLKYFDTTEKGVVEIYSEGLGWLIVLTNNIEIVSDNWFASTKYSSSELELVDEEAALLKLTNVYKLNSSFVENANNVKYNLMFDEIHLYADKISAFF